MRGQCRFMSFLPSDSRNVSKVKLKPKQCIDAVSQYSIMQSKKVETSSERMSHFWGGWIGGTHSTTID